MFYLNKDRPFIINSEIIEWDIKSANLSIIKEYNLLSEGKIEKIEKMDKQDRVIFVGKEMAKDPAFSKILEESFNSIIDKFIELNDLDKNYDVLTIKRDAVFIINKKPLVTKIGNNINFIPKNTYTSFIYIKPYEFYFTNNGNIEIKGLSKNFETEIKPLHENGILEFLNDVVAIAVNSNMNFKKMNTYLSEFVTAYKNRELPFDYYREFNASSKFKYVMYENEMLMDNIDDSILDSIDIQYNYINIILPLIQLINI